MRVSTHLTDAHHSANVGRTLTQKPAQGGGGSLGAPTPLMKAQCSYHHWYEINTGGQCGGQNKKTLLGE